MITEEKRLEAITSVFMEAEKIYEKVSNSIPEIQETEEEVEKRRVLIVAPDQGETIKGIYEICNTDEIEETDEISEEEFTIALKIYPFFNEDTAFGEIFKHYALHELGTYSHCHNMVILNMEASETKLFQAHTLLHELQHMLYAFKEKRMLGEDMRSDHERIAEETKIWTVDYKILLAIGGKKFRKEIKKTARQIHQCLQKKLPVEPMEKGHLLESAYGPPPSKIALWRRHQYFMIYAVLIAADFYYDDPQQQERLKHRILSPEYERAYLKYGNPNQGHL